MVRNESLARMMMLLCFGGAILSLAIQWGVHNSTKPDVTSATEAKTPKKVSFAQPPQIRHGTTGNQPKWLVAEGTTPQQSSSHSVSAKTSVIVKLSDRRAYVYQDGEVIASYPIAVGKKGWETPIGSYQVMNMQTDPLWRHPITGKVFPPGANSPLGIRWIGFWSDGRDQIGFHGTPDEELVGTPISHGCLRMRNSDVRLLYQQVHLGTTVEVRK